MKKWGKGADEESAGGIWNKNTTIIMALWGDAKTNCDGVAGFYLIRIKMNY